MTYHISDYMLTITSVEVDILSAFVLYIIIFLISLFLVVYRQYIFKVIRAVIRAIGFIFIIILASLSGGDTW